MISTKNIMIITAFAVLSGCGSEAVTESIEVVRPAKFIEVTASSNVKHFNFPAVVQAISSKELTFQVSGQIEVINVKEGQAVKKGDLIAKLVQRSFKNDLKTAETQYKIAKLDYDRTARLMKDNAIARNVYDQRLSELNVASSQLDTAKKAVEDTVLRSPFDGVIAIKHAKELDNVSTSQEIVTIQTVGAAEALVKIPSSLIARSKQIEPIQTTIILDSASQYEIPTAFVAASAIADSRSQTFEVRFGFTPPEEITILPGMTGVIKSTLKLSSSSDKIGQISIPITAIVSDSEGQFVWKVNVETMSVSKQSIKVGAGVGQLLVIESGLNVGDIIVGAGASYLNEGMKVRRLDQ